MNRQQKLGESSGERLSWPELREYWERHSELRAPLDDKADLDALQNVLHPTMPAYVNGYYARFQSQIFGMLLESLPAR
jgi:hypothetical protein